MYKPEKQVGLGVRIPQKLKEYLAEYCETHGIKMNYFVSEAIRQHLLDSVDDQYDVEAARKRLAKPVFVAEKAMNAYLTKRKIKK